MSLIGDEYEAVSSLCRRVLADYRKHTGNNEVITILQENVYELATKLPRLIRVTGEE